MLNKIFIFAEKRNIICRKQRHTTVILYFIGMIIDIFQILNS
jgi:hypothetical protein